MFNYGFGSDLGPDGLTPEDRIRQLQSFEEFRSPRASDMEGVAPPDIQDGPTPMSQGLMAGGAAILQGRNKDFLGQLGAGGAAFQQEFQRQRQEQRAIEQLRFKNEQDAQSHKERLAAGERDAIRQEVFVQDRDQKIRDEATDELEQQEIDKEFNEDNLGIIATLEQRAAAGDKYAVKALESVGMYVNNDTMGGEEVHNFIKPVFDAASKAASIEQERQAAGDQYGKVIGDKVVMTRPDGTQYLADAPGLEGRRSKASSRTAAELVSMGATSSGGSAILNALKFSASERRARAEDFSKESLVEPLSEDEVSDRYGPDQNYDEYVKAEPGIMAARGYYKNEDGQYVMKTSEAEKTVNFRIFQNEGIPIDRERDIPKASLAQIGANANKLIKEVGLSPEEATSHLAELLLGQGLTEELAVRLAKRYVSEIDAPTAAGGDQGKAETLAEEIKREAEEGKGLLQKTSEWWANGRQGGYEPTGNELFPAMIEGVKDTIGDVGEFIKDFAGGASDSGSAGSVAREKIAQGASAHLDEMKKIPPSPSRAYEASLNSPLGALGRNEDWSGAPSPVGEIASGMAAHAREATRAVPSPYRAYLDMGKSPRWKSFAGDVGKELVGKMPVRIGEIIVEVAHSAGGTGTPHDVVVQLKEELAEVGLNIRAIFDQHQNEKGDLSDLELFRRMTSGLPPGSFPKTDQYTMSGSLDDVWKELKKELGSL